MAKMTEEEKNVIKKSVKKEGQRMFSIAYGFIGGGLCVIVTIQVYFIYQSCLLDTCWLIRKINISDTWLAQV